MEAEAATESPLESHVVIVGVGLIGGSIAAALRRRMPNCRITGIGRDVVRLRKAADAGLLDEFGTSISADLGSSGWLAVVCLPVDRIAEAVQQLIAIGADDSLVTDAGSVKSLIYQQLAAEENFRGGACGFVGSHPIAGGEQSGFEYAQADLFEGRMCVVTPENAVGQAVHRICEFWRHLGSTIRMMSAEEHDRVLARTSHLPHVLAAVAAGCVAAEMLPFTGTGFRDTTRIAEGSAEMWSQILCGNGLQIEEAILAAESRLQVIRQAIRSGDRELLHSVLAAAADLRRQLSGVDAAATGDGAR